MQQFRLDRRTHTAAQLSFYFLLAAVPGLTAILSIFNVFGEGPETVTRILDRVEQASGQEAAAQLEQPLMDLVQSPAGGAAFVIGILVALWSASKYVSAFGQDINDVYDMPEGRPLWLRRLQTFLVTILAIVMVVAIVACVVGSSSLVEALGFSGTAATVWMWTRFPLAVILTLLLIALLYLTTSNVKRPALNPATLGALIALLSWIVLSGALYLYAVVIGGFSSTYGSMAGVLIILFWLWLSNMALLFGAQFDAEVERVRQLQAGIRAEDVIQLAPRSRKKIVRDARTHARFQGRGRALRESAGATDGDEKALPV
ncbi:YihY/virulence factor BrkB family protein [Brevibacterium daeguense]|uniref:YihY/virulence factor BrkB family protein n=1 Tax=Brevibacterium daeguense TaxID=909936 RepID=A0ABP8EHS9_9MICO